MTEEITVTVFNVPPECEVEYEHLFPIDVVSVAPTSGSSYLISQDDYEFLQQLKAAYRS